MKKWCAVLLAAAVLVHTSVCTSAKESAPAASEKNSEELMILDNDTATVQLTEVYAIPLDKKDVETEEPAVGFTLSVTNHGEKEIVMDVRNLRVGEQPVVRVLLEGDIITPEDTQEYRYGIFAEADDASDPEEKLLVSLQEVLDKGISGDLVLMSMEGEAGKASFSFTGDTLPQP
ncbi:MAG: hypothetical protein K5852_06050 [Eubacterium sp.]|nr:hypothetical protein [Eubacterium sp.]